MPQLPFVTALPMGIPYLAGSFGSSIHRKGDVPPAVFTNDWDLWFVLEGQLTLTLGSGERLEAIADHFLLLPPLTRAERSVLKRRLHLWFCHFAFRPVPVNLFASVEQDCWTRDRDLLIPLVFSRKAAPDVWQAYRALLTLGDERKHIESVDARQYWKTGAPWQFETVIINLARELLMFARRLDFQAQDGHLLQAPPSTDARVAKLCSAIQANPSFPWNVPQLARHAGLSLGHLERLCRASMGQSLKSYIVAARLNYAKAVLRSPEAHGNKSLKNISYACGYSSQQLFSREYKRFFGVSPLKERSRM